MTQSSKHPTKDLIWPTGDVYCSTPSAGIWEHLSFFESPDFTQRFISRLHTGKTTEWYSRKAVLVKRCFQQAREYYEAASAVSDRTKPVLLFYGMMNLTASLLLIRRGDVNEESLPQQHGASVFWPQPIGSLLNIECKIDDRGTARFLGETVVKDRFAYDCALQIEGLTSSMRVYSHRNAADAWTQLLSNGNSKIHFNTLAQFHPELSQYFRNMELPARCARVRAFFHEHPDDTTSAEFHITFTGHHDTDQILRERMGSLPDWKPVRSVGNSTRYHARTKVLEHPPLREGRNGDMNIVVHKDGEVLLAESTSIYLMMFILSQAARYKPNFWIPLMEENRGEGQLAHAVMELSEHKFPNLILNDIVDGELHFEIT